MGVFLPACGGYDRLISTYLITAQGHPVSALACATPPGVRPGGRGAPTPAGSIHRPAGAGAGFPIRAHAQFGGHDTAIGWMVTTR